MEFQPADFGTSVTPISDRLRVEATQAQQLLEPYGVSLLNAAQHYVASQAPAAGQKNLAQRERLMVDLGEHHGASQPNVVSFQ